MSWIKSIVTVICCHCFLMTVAQAADARSVASAYQCPAFLQLDTHSHALEIAEVYDGPIEEMAELKPRPVPDDDAVEPAFWDYGGIPSERSFYIKCVYKDIGHYLVLEAKGAHRCTFITQAQTRCK